jgi:iron complex transport system permease protein
LANLTAVAIADTGASEVVRPADAPGRRARRFIALLGLLAAASVLSLFIGSNGIAPSAVVRALLLGEDGTDAEIVRQFRLTRLLLGLSVGAALGLAGAVMQALTRNPLADPGLLGVSAGASTGVVLAIAVFGLTAPGAYVWFALAGAAAASALVYALGSAGPAASGPARLALAGAAVTIVLLSIVRAMTLLDPDTFDVYRFWVVGSLAGRPLSVFWQTFPFLVVGAVMALSLARSLDALALGSELSRALGSRPSSTP